MSDPHPPSSELGYLELDDVRTRIAAGDLTSQELTTALLARIDALDAPRSPTALRSLAALSSDAVDVASRCDEPGGATPRGPLWGVPVVIKDNIEAEGLPATAGSTALVGRAARDAALVTRLRRAGAIILGSTNLSQWANIRSPRSTSGWSATGGLVANPWALDRSAGGSSSGSGAALAAGLATLAVGTETDGSIVCPASLNGVVGLKPTVGVTSTRGVVPISASQDSPGPMARCVADVAALFGVLAAQDPPRPTSPTVSIGVATNWLSGHRATDELVGSVVAALASSQVTVVRREVSEPTPEVHEDELTVLLSELVDDLGAYLAHRPGEGVTSLADVIAYEDAHAEVELSHFGHEFFVTALASGGRRGDAFAAARARNLEWALSSCLVPGLADVDVLVAAAYGPAWKSDLVIGGSPAVASCATTAPAIAGWPIMSVPIGLVGGLPVGLALIGRPHDEWTLLRAARHVEEVVAQREFARPSWRAPSRG